MQTALLTLACVAALLASSAGPASAAGLRASTVTYAWTTTAGFDAGAKAGVGTATDTCENVSANRIALNNTGAFEGVGLTTNASTCATGAWGVSSSALAVSWDMQTLSGANFKDFSGNGRDGTVTTGLQVPAKFGSGRSLTNGNLSRSALSLPDMGNLSFVVVVKKPWSAGSYAGIAGIFQGTNSAWTIFTNGQGNGNLNFRVDTPGHPNQNMIGTYNISDGSFHVLAGRINNANHTVRIYADGVLVYTLPYSGFLLQTPGYLSLGGPIDQAAQMVGVEDEFALWDRGFSEAELKAASTDGRSSFLSSGSWTSPAMPVTHGVPTVASLSFGNVSANRSIADVEILDGATGFRVWHWGKAINASTSATMPVLSPPTLKSWKVRVNLAGNGTGTPFVSSVSVGVAFPPGSSSSTGPANPTWFGYWWPWVALLGIAALVAVAGAAEHRKRKRS